MTGLHSRQGWLLTAVLVAFVVMAAWYSVSIPLGEAPDEVPHFTYVRYLAQHGRLPTTTEEHEAFQPPLYYALGAALTFWIDDLPDAPFAVRANADFDVVDPRAPKNLLLHSSKEDWPYRGWVLAWHMVRLASVALGAVTVWAVYRLGLLFFPSRPAIPLVMAALTSFTPQFLFMSAVANNDNAAVAASALVLWQTAALVTERPPARTWKRAVTLGLLLGAGLLSKASLIGLLPVVGLAFLVAEVRRAGWRAGLLRALLIGLAVLGLASLVAGWYFVRNWRLYGDPLGWSFLLEINALREGPLTLEVLAWLFKGVFRSFWLGWIGIALDEAGYWLLAAVCLGGLTGSFARLVRRWRALDVGVRWAVALLALHAALTVGSLIQWTATVLGTDQGRLVYPVLPTVMLTLVAGWSWWVRRPWRPWVLGGLVAGMLALAILTPFRYIVPVHAPAPVASQAELDAAQALDIDWDGVRLLGYQLAESEVSPGEKLELDLYWQALRPVEKDLMLLIQLVDQDGQFLMYTDGSPAAGRDTTDRWAPGVPLSSLHLLPIPDYGLPGDYRLTLSLHPFAHPQQQLDGRVEWLPAVGPDGAVLGDHITLPETIHLVPR